MVTCGPACATPAVISAASAHVAFVKVRRFIVIAFLLWNTKKAIARFFIVQLFGRVVDRQAVVLLAFFWEK